ncbi:MAG: glycosyltransferase family 2 protein [bacterium]
MSELSVVILTYNEEENIAQALESVCGWADKVVVLDSFSTDKTVEIASTYPCEIFTNRFKGYADQRNHSIKNLGVDSEWMLFLDADEWVSVEAKEEIKKLISKVPKENGFYIKRRFIWMGKWIRRGYYPTWLLRLFRTHKSHCESRLVNEHIVVDGDIGFLQNDIIHDDQKGISEWINRQNKFATLEMEELFKNRNNKDENLNVTFFGTQAERKRWLREKIWNKLPPLIRPFFYFHYRYFVRGGFLDGKEAFIYHFLQGLWLPFLIDVKYLMKKKQVKSEKK